MMRRSQQRGVALVLVLGTLVLVTSTLGLLTLAAAQGHRSASLVTDERRADDLLNACEPLVQDWLTSKANRAVVDPESPEPKVQLSSIKWTESNESYSVSMAAWDLRGMLHADTSSASPLWLGIDAQLRDLELGDAQTLIAISGLQMPLHPEIHEFNAGLGAQIAVYPAQAQRRSGGGNIAPTININTAPRPLLEASLRLAQRGDIASILAARSDERPAPAPNRSSNDQEGLVTLTGRSTLWAVRVDAAASGVSRSWWTVYESRRSGWEIVERHAIGE